MMTLKFEQNPKAWFPLVLRIVRIGDFYDIPTSGILRTSGNTSSQKSQTIGDFYDVIGRIGIISHLKVLPQTSSVNLAVLRIAIVVRIPVSGNRKNPRFLRFLGQVEPGLKHFKTMARDGTRWHEKTRQGTRRHGARGHGMFPTLFLVALLISDHDLVYVIRHARLPKIKKDPKIVTVKSTKNLNNDTMIKDQNELPFELIRASAYNPLVKLEIFLS